MIAHSPWGQDPSGHCGCADCSAPDDLGRHCRAGCATKDHATWGDCARAAHIQVDRAALAEGRK